MRANIKWTGIGPFSWSQSAKSCRRSEHDPRLEHPFKRNRVPVCRTFICREQMKSAQGCLERVLNTGNRYFFSPAILATRALFGPSVICCELNNSVSFPE